MRFFTCVLDPEGRGIDERVRRGYEALPRERGLEFQWQSFDYAAVLTGWDDPYGAPLIVEDGDWIAAGMVRLDNREELGRWGHCGQRISTDLELTLRIVARYGSEYVSKLLGDFAFIAWNGKTRCGVAACDAFSVQRMFVAEHDGLLAFASRAEALARHEEYETRYLTERVALRPQSRDISVYAGVRPVPAASLVVLRAGRSVAVQRYWSPYNYHVEPSWANKEDDVAEACRELIAESIRLRMGRRGETWAQLSGGMDSSSVVSCAQWLAERGQCANGLAGTVTFVDQHGAGTDEREYSDAVVD